MIRSPERIAIGRLLRWVAAISTVLVLPWSSYDPINVPKLAVISAGGFMALGFIVQQWKIITGHDYRTSFLVSLAFIFDLILVLVISGNNFTQEFFGTYGRATGFVAYVALAGLLMAGVLSSTDTVILRFSWFLIGSGVISAGYGVFQATGVDPANWVNSYSPVIGFLGNPDFQSSFVGLSAVMAVAMLLKKGLRNSIKAGLLVFVFTTLYVISETKAQQGYFVFLGGSSVVVFVLIYKSKAKKLTLPLFASGFIALIFVAMGSLNVGPLASLLHKASVVYRGDYWRAGWKMTMDHPFFGVGLDSYGDWYRRTRTIEATVRRGPEVTSNAAHNVLIDFSSNGGFPLLIIYLALLALAARAATRVIRRTSEFDPAISGLFAVWIAYQAQSLISLNQLGLAVWGWIISGLLIGYEINTSTNLEEVGVSKSRRHNSKAKIPIGLKVQPAFLSSLFIGFSLGLLIGLPPLIASTQFKTALDSPNKTTLENAAEIFPQDVFRAGQIAYIFQQNKLEDEALSIITASVENYPDSYESWRLLASLSNASPAQIAEAKAQMKRLDPHNPELK